MKYCTHCGKELADAAAICPGCGCATGDVPLKPEADSDSYVLRLIAKILMVLTCVATGFFLIPLCWTVPMTVKYWRAVDRGTPVSVAFKVCTLIFVNTIAGILMLCDND